MQSTRPHPFDLVFGDAVSNLEQIRKSLAEAGRDPRDRDAFLLQREVVELLRDLRPSEGLGEGIDQLAALVHHAYLFWDVGCHTVDCGSNELTSLLGNPSIEQSPGPTPHYVQFPARRIWAQAVPDEAHEPLDGCFIFSWPGSRSLHVLGVFGVHPDRAGFSVVEVAGPRPSRLIRPDGTDLFSPVLPGGTAAGLYAVAGEEELLELGWRTQSLAPATTVEAERWKA